MAVPPGETSSGRAAGAGPVRARRAPLDGTRVLEIAQSPAAAYCGRLMADHGAEVIKVEPAGGDPTRKLPPFMDGRSDADAGGPHQFLNANKSSVCLDLATPTGRDVLAGLARTCDVVVEDHPPGWLDDHGLGYDVLATARPDLTMVSITPFGQDGPDADRPATDLTVEALGSWVYAMGEPEREPLRPPGFQASLLGGVWGAIVGTATLRDARRTGVGDHVDVSLLEIVISFQMNVTTTYEYSGALSPRRGGASNVNFPQGVFPCQDGLVGINVMYYVEWERFCSFMGRPDWYEDPRLATPLLRAENRELIEETLLPWLMERTAEEIYRKGQEAKLPFARVSSPADLLASEQLASRGYWRRITVPGAGEITLPGPPFKMADGAWSLERAAPSPGQDGARLIGDVLDHARETIVEMTAARAL